MPYEDNDVKCDEFVRTLSLLEDLINRYSDYHIIIGGDFNVDFSRDWVHTALLDSFCENVGLLPVVRHANCNIDYSYNFNMSRFNILDHFLLSSTLFYTCVDGVSVQHSVDNLSDHEPIFLNLKLDASYIGVSEHVFKSCSSWVRATDSDKANYRAVLSYNLSNIPIPYNSILCVNALCNNCEHVNAINQYAAAITNSCLSASETAIPHTSNRSTSKRVPGWSERVEPLRLKSLFWHDLWVDNDRPRSGAVADCMRRTRAAYHYAIRQVKRDEDNIVRERIAAALVDDPGRNLWAEIKSKAFEIVRLHTAE
jgi:hypothetical protein